MSCSVNLVPTVRRHARARARRRDAWLTAGGAALLMSALAWLLELTAAGTLARLRADYGALEVQRADMERRLVHAGAERDRLIEQLRTVSGARRPQPWAGRLLRLTEAAPADVFLTALNIVTPQDLSRRPGAFPPSGAPDALAGAAAEELERPQTLQVSGFALDHNALIQLLSALQALREFGKVELLRATSEDVRGSTWVAFEIVCETKGGTL